MKHIFISQSEKEMGRNKQHRKLEAIMDSRQKKSEDVVGSYRTLLDNHAHEKSDRTADNIQMPNVTFCDYLGKCPIPTRKKCMFNSGYENCNVYKFYEKWRK